MKSLGSKPWMLPQPVLIIGTYDKEGKANAMNAAWGSHIRLGETEGKAFSDGKQLK